eukprot:CAMPEP_0206223798 /NCGR_PEP_ID=MMETSP0047_2-20121206/6680_1 /ASSEMBLY_ACC=CAM_ASM_000192 /TAXON_ID=195065 /ORGANISM="Chroomonas mesostigmatica_cf, Strain CCMP1168" /LENGTH=140 /DNA_ID=CAMNT_0053646703 /DNA_START=242 /DNA_END=660 /DNA_ORIENTATION=-
MAQAGSNALFWPLVCLHSVFYGHWGLGGRRGDGATSSCVPKGLYEARRHKHGGDEHRGAVAHPKGPLCAGLEPCDGLHRHPAVLGPCEHCQGEGACAGHRELIKPPPLPKPRPPRHPHAVPVQLEVELEQLFVRSPKLVP